MNDSFLICLFFLRTFFQELGDAQVMVGHFGGGALDPDFFGVPLSSRGLEPGHIGAENQVPLLIKVPLISQPSFPQLGGIKEHTTSKGSWQAGAPGNQFSIKDQPLGSPCSVISGFTKAGDPVGSDSNMATSFAGTSSSHGAHGHESNLESPVTATQTESETQVGYGAVTKKRKRPKTQKQDNEVEISQRMTHIAVERNRRKQMNEHLAVLRALMPGSYIQKVILTLYVISEFLCDHYFKNTLSFQKLFLFLSFSSTSSKVVHSQ